MGRRSTSRREVPSVHGCSGTTAPASNAGTIIAAAIDASLFISRLRSSPRFPQVLQAEANTNSRWSTLKAESVLPAGSSGLDLRDISRENERIGSVDRSLLQPALMASGAELLAPSSPREPRYISATSIRPSLMRSRNRIRKSPRHWLTLLTAHRWKACSKRALAAWEAWTCWSIMLVSLGLRHRLR